MVKTVAATTPVKIDRGGLMSESLSREEVELLVGLPEQHDGVELDGWFELGIVRPPDAATAEVDGIRGTFHVTEGGVAALIGSLLEQPKISFDVFPLGTVAPTHFRVDFRSTRL